MTLLSWLVHNGGHECSNGQRQIDQMSFIIMGQHTLSAHIACVVSGVMHRVSNGCVCSCGLG